MCQLYLQYLLVVYHRQNCDTILAANSVSLRILYLDRIDSIIPNSRQHSASEEISRGICVLVCSWTCSSSLCVTTVSTDQLQTVQFVQYLYSKCAVLLCSWTCSSSLCVITVSTVQLQTVQFVQYLYSKCAVLLCSWTCSSSFCVITVSTVSTVFVQ